MINVRSSSSSRVALVALGGLLSSVAPARAESLKSGLLCGFVTVSDPIGQASTQTGVIFGGPAVVVDKTNPATVHTGHLTCTIQVGSANNTHAGPDRAVASGPDAPLVVGLPPSQLNYSATQDDNVYLCTSITTEEGTWYLGSPDDPTVPCFWSTSNTVGCGLAVSVPIDTGSSRSTVVARVETCRLLDLT